MIRIINNRFAKKCTICNKNVAASMGFAVSDNNFWHTFHKECLPNCYNAPAEVKPTISQVSENEIRLNFPYNQAIVELIKQISFNYRKFDAPSKSWHVIINKHSIEKVKNVIQLLNLEQTKNISDFVPLSEEDETNCSETISEIDDFAELKSRGLFDFQIKGVNFLRNKKRALLGDSMGLGKSIQALTALPKAAKVIIVAPSCVKYNWQKEIKKWRQDYESVVISGKSKFVFPNTNQIIIINREILPDFLDLTDRKILDDETIRQIKDCILIVDEAHKFKSTKTIGSKKLKTLSKHAKICWLLTGTPILNRALDIWGVLSAGCMEKEVFGNFENFKYLYNAREGRFGTDYGMPRPEVPQLISKIRLARNKEEVLPELPKKIYTKMIVSLQDTEEGQRIIKMIESLDPEIQKMINEDNMLPPFNKFSRIRSEIAKNRIPALIEYIEDCEENEIPIVVFSHHISPLNAIRTKSNWGIIEGATPPEIRQQIVENFQNGLLDGIACTIEAGGVGLTMTRAQKVIFVDLDWTPANNWQAEDRICRIGSKHRSVEVIHMISDHPLDCHVHNLLEQKKELIQKSLN